MLSRAPGKVMIAGEYSVLLGQSALVASINREARCSFEPESAMKFSMKTAQSVHHDNAPLFQAVIKTLDHYSLKPSNGHYVLDTSDFFDELQQKIGLGSSAAGVVALIKNILCQHGIEDLAYLFRLSHEAHRLFSGGVGSGADIAASTYGGTLKYRFDGPPFVQHVDMSSIWPYLFVVHLGKPQSTIHFVEKFLSSDLSLVEKFTQESAKQTKFLCAHLDEIDAFIQAFHTLFDLLDDLGKTIGIDIVSKEHRAIAHIARSCSGAAKPSGAGGGDIALVMVPKKNRISFIEQLKKTNFSLLPLSLAPKTAL